MMAIDQSQYSLDFDAHIDLADTVLHTVGQVGVPNACCSLSQLTGT